MKVSADHRHKSISYSFLLRGLRGETSLAVRSTEENDESSISRLLRILASEDSLEQAQQE